MVQFYFSKITIQQLYLIKLLLNQIWIKLDNQIAEDVLICFCVVVFLGG